MKRVICSECQGAGKIQVSSDGVDEMVVCYTCNGHGVIIPVPIDNRITFDGDETDISDPAGRLKLSKTLEDMTLRQAIELFKRWFR